MSDELASKSFESRRAASHYFRTVYAQQPVKQLKTEHRRIEELLSPVQKEAPGFASNRVTLVNSSNGSTLMIVSTLVKKAVLVIALVVSDLRNSAR